MGRADRQADPKPYKNRISEESESEEEEHLSNRWVNHQKSQKSGGGGRRLPLQSAERHKFSIP